MQEKQQFLTITLMFFLRYPLFEAASASQGLTASLTGHGFIQKKIWTYCVSPRDGLNANSDYLVRNQLPKYITRQPWGEQIHVCIYLVSNFMCS